MDASNPANGQSETHAIAPTGDTILVVGDRKTELQVHSFCMRTASKVFDAMFGPHFLEGQPSNGNHPKNIPMPDDNAAAMTTICNVIHHRNDLLPDVLQPSELPEIALAADKYDCVLVLKYVMIQWLDFKEPITFFDLGSLLIAAYVFDNSDAFRRVAQKLITGFPCAYHSLMQSKYGETIPLSIYYSLERARTRTRVNVQDLLLPEMAHYCDYPKLEGCGPLLVLLKDNMWGASLLKVSIDSVIERAGKMVLPTHSSYTYKEQQLKETRYSKVNELKYSAGLCLSCVRSGNLDANFPCSLDH